MLQFLLTLMLFIMPFLLAQKDSPHLGLHTGLWVSLFFWGRLHPFFSILIFTVSVFYYIVVQRNESAWSSLPGLENLTWSHVWIPRSRTRPLTAFLAVLIIFCAFGNVCADYGAALNLNPLIQESALFLGFAGSLTGPILFGACSDKKGPFSAFMWLLLVGLGALAFIALSPDFPYFFPLGSLLIQVVICGVFTLMPQLLLRFYGKPQLHFVLPFLLLFLAGLWSGALFFYHGADALPQDYLLSMVFLLVMALPLARKAWRRRLGVL